MLCSLFLVSLSFDVKGIDDQVAALQHWFLLPSELPVFHLSLLNSFSCRATCSLQGLALLPPVCLPLILSKEFVMASGADAVKMTLVIDTEFFQVLL